MDSLPGGRQRYAYAAAGRVTIGINDLDRHIEAYRIGRRHRSAKVSDFEWVSRNPSVFECIIAIGSEDSDRSCNIAVSEYAANIDTFSIAIESYRESVPGYNMGGAKRFR